MALPDPLDPHLLPAETHSFAAPIPTQFVASDEFPPGRQTAAQRQVEALLPYADVRDVGKAAKDWPRRAKIARDKVALARIDYGREGPWRTNRRYGYVASPMG